MKKVMLIGQHGYDYEYCGGFEDSGLTVEELAVLVKENNGDFEDEENGFGASFINIEGSLTETDIKTLNGLFCDSHEEQLFVVEV